MKICPQCQTSYTDDTLRFCLQDGTPLLDQESAGSFGEQETVVSPRQTEKVQAAATNAQSQNWTQRNEAILPESPKKTNTTSIVVVTALLTILAVAAGAAGVWFYLRGGKTETARNTNSKTVNVVVPNASNANQAQNANANANTTPTATPTPKPTLNPKEARNIQSDIEDAVGDWRDALENLDLDGHLSNYADTVDYYRAGKTGIGAVRADKQRAFEAYNNIDIDISNLKITPDETGEKAVAVFDKEWKFEGEGSYSSGKVRQELQFVKIAGKWRISGEKDLQVYYTNR
jgi:ketosteroid isomerase-like protein